MTKIPSAVYWDSSAILSVMFQDKHSTEAQKLLKTDGVHFISTLAYAETCAVIYRMQQESIIANVLVSAAFEVLEQGPWRRINTWPDWELVRDLSSKHRIKGADLWHLAVTKTLQQGFPELILVTYDKHLKKAAKAEKLPCDL